MKPLKTLIVEDSEMDEKLLLRQLAKAGYDVESARVQTAADLENTLAERDWDIVLSDYVMPGFTGLDALRVLRESGQDIPLIIISGTIGEETAVEAMRIGVHDYLMKGNLTRLAPAIERELANAARRREQKQAEESLRLSEANLANAQRIARLGSWHWDVVNDNFFWSEESYRIFGRTKTQFAGTFEAFLETVHSDDRRKVQAAVDATLTRNDPHSYEHRIVRPDGQERIVYEIGELSFDEAGKPLHFTGTVQDITERVAAETEMRVMKSAVDSIVEGILISDARKPDTPTVYSNAAFEHLTGYSFVEIEGRNCRFLQGANTDRRTVDEIRESVKNHQTFHGEILNYHKNGAPFWNDLSISPVFDKTGLVTHYVGVQQDISERKLSEQALTEAARRERLMIENALDVICTVNPNGEFVSVNPACLKVWGYSSDELVGRRYIELVAPEDVAKTNEAAISIMSGFETIDFENRYRHKNGSLVPIRWSAYWSDQEQLMFAVAHDITAQRRMENELRHSESRMRALLDAIPDLMFRCDRDGVILDFSATHHEDLLLPPNEFIGKNMRDVLPPAVARQTVRHIAAAIESGTMQIFEYQLEIKGVEKSYEARIVAAGKSEVTAIVRDVTERKQSEDKLRRSEANLSAAQRITHLGSWEVELSDLRRVNNNKVHWSEEVYRIFGYQPGAIRVSINSYFDSIHPDDRKYCRRAFIEAVLDRKDLNIEFRVVLPNGGEKILHGQAEVVYDEQSNQPLKFIGTVQDITGRKQAAEKIRERGEWLQAVLDGSRDGIVIEDGLQISYVNKSYGELLGYDSPKELIDKQISDFLPPDEFQRLTEYGRQRLRDEPAPSVYEFKTKHKDGSLVEVEGAVSTGVIGGKKFIMTAIRDISERKQIENELRQSEEKYRLLIENAKDIIYTLDLSGRFTSLNRAGEQITGYPRDKALQISITDVVDPNDLARVRERIAKNLSGVPQPNFELEIITRSGNKVLLDISSRIIYQDGAPVGIQGIGRDITERKRAEAAVQQSERDYRTVFEQAHDAILIFAPEREIVLEVNQRACEIYGFNRSEFIGMSIETISKIPANGKEKVKETQEIGEYLNFETVQYRKDGSEMFLEVNASTIDYQGQEAIITINRDITERKKAERKLQHAESKYRNLVESSPAIVYLAEPYPPFSPIYVSPNVKRLGYTAEEWFEQPDIWISLIHEDDRTRVLRATKDAMEKRDETELEYRMIGRDGSVHWCQDKGRFVTDEQGNTTGWQGVIVDITKTKELEEQLRQSQKLESVGLLAGGIAHDFNNMLTAINGYSDLTLRRLKPDDPLRLNIEEIKKAGERSAALTHQLLAFSRQQILQPVVFDLNEAIGELLKMLQRLIGEDIQLTATLNPKAGRVKVDPGQFSQIVMNLAVNARDAMPQGGRLTVETANVFLDPDYASQRVGVLPGAYVMLAISDTGVGMNNETKAHIFEPFYTTKDVGQGTGLGLATVYGIVKQSGGNIEVYSEESVGTTFKVYMPRVGELTTLEKARNIAADMPRGSETIFLVEDEQMVRQLSRQILEECGYTVIEAQNGVEALKIYDEAVCNFDLLITDVVMPQMGGRELSEILKSRLPELQILFTSGYTDDAIVRHGVIETKSNFIQKPFSPETLANKVRKILDNFGKG